jgi:hypothetical protein
MAVVRSYRLVRDTIGPLLGALVIVVVVVSVLSVSIIFLPIAVWLAVRWALVVPAVELEDRRALGALRRSGELVRRQWLKVGTLVAVAALIAVAAGPVLGAILILVVGAPFGLVNVVAGLVYAVAMPFVGIATTYVYYDTFVRERQEAKQPSVLPAEV